MVLGQLATLSRSMQSEFPGQSWQTTLVDGPNGPTWRSWQSIISRRHVGQSTLSAISQKKRERNKKKRPALDVSVDGDEDEDFFSTSLKLLSNSCFPPKWRVKSCNFLRIYVNSCCIKDTEGAMKNAQLLFGTSWITKRKTSFPPNSIINNSIYVKRELGRKKNRAHLHDFAFQL